MICYSESLDCACGMLMCCSLHLAMMCFCTAYPTPYFMLTCQVPEVCCWSWRQNSPLGGFHCIWQYTFHLSVYFITESSQTLKDQSRSRRLARDSGGYGGWGMCCCCSQNDTRHVDYGCSVAAKGERTKPHSAFNWMLSPIDPYIYPIDSVWSVHAYVCVCVLVYVCLCFLYLCACLLTGWWGVAWRSNLWERWWASSGSGTHRRSSGGIPDNRTVQIRDTCMCVQWPYYRWGAAGVAIYNKMICLSYIHYLNY